MYKKIYPQAIQDVDDPVYLLEQIWRNLVSQVIDVSPVHQLTAVKSENIHVWNKHIHH